MNLVSYTCGSLVLFDVSVKRVLPFTSYLLTRCPTMSHPSLLYFISPSLGSVRLSEFTVADMITQPPDGSVSTRAMLRPGYAVRRHTHTHARIFLQHPLTRYSHTFSSHNQLPSNAYSHVSHTLFPSSSSLAFYSFFSTVPFIGS